MAAAFTTLARLTVTNCIITDNLAAAGNDFYDYGSDGSYIFDPVGPSPGGNGGSGGGIYNLGTLKMNDSIVTENSAGPGQDGHGGGSGGSGGGVYNAGNLTLSDCIVCDNSSGAGGNGVNELSAGDVGGNGAGGNGGSGGGLFNLADASQARLIATSVIRNFAGQGGSGGIFEGIGTGSNGSPGIDGSGPNLFGNFTFNR